MNFLLEHVIAESRWGQIVQMVILIVAPAAVIVAKKLEKEPINLPD